MMQLIFFILKLIGWILLAVVCLLILILLTALFLPLHYRVAGSSKGTLSSSEAALGFHILFHLVSGSIQYKDGELTWNVRAAWKKLGNRVETEAVTDKVAGEIESTVETADAVLNQKAEKESGRERAAESVQREETVRKADGGENPGPGNETDAEEKPDTTQKVHIAEKSDAEKKADMTEKSDAEKKADMTERSDAEKKADMTKKSDAGKKADREEKKDTEKKEQGRQGQPEGIFEKSEAVFEKIKCTFLRIYDKLNVLLKKKEVLMEFLTNEVHQSAFLKGLRELKRLLFRMRPKKIGGSLQFGFEDPSLTGRVFGGISMLSPVTDGHVSFYPDFEHKILDGDLSVEGSVRMLPAAAFACRMLLNRNVRKTIRDIKNFSFDV